MERKIFFFDFDDTLYSHSARCVPQSARDAISRLQSDGHAVVIATGRGQESMTFIQQELALPCDMMIFLNGQLIFRKGNKIFERFIALPSLAKIMDKAKELGLAYGGYYANGEVVNRVNERVMSVWQDFNCPLPNVMERFEDIYSLYQGHLYITKEEAENWQEHLSDYLMNWSHEYLANLISKEAGKSQGVRWIMNEAGIALEHSYAFGDGFNDVDMLQSVGHGIAMGNASDKLKRAAEFVTGTAGEDGVWHALEHYKLI